MRLGRDDAPDGVKSVLSGLPRPLAAVMPVTLRSCSVPGQEGWPKPSAQFDPGWSTIAGMYITKPDARTTAHPPLLSKSDLLLEWMLGMEVAGNREECIRNLKIILLQG